MARSAWLCSLLLQLLLLWPSLFSGSSRSRGWGRGGSHLGPARSKLQGHGLQVHIPEAASLLWQVSTKDPQIREHKEHSVKAVTSGPGSHKTQSPQQVFPSQLPSVPRPHSQPPSCPGSTPDINRGSGKSLETPLPSPQPVPMSEEYSGMSRVLLGRDHICILAAYPSQSAEARPTSRNGTLASPSRIFSRLQT